MAQWESGKESMNLRQPLEDITQSDTKITYVIKILDIIRKQIRNRKYHLLLYSQESLCAKHIVTLQKRYAEARENV